MRLINTDALQMVQEALDVDDVVVAECKWI